MKSSRSKLHLVHVAAVIVLLVAAAPAHAFLFSGARLVELMREYEKSQAGRADVLWGNLGRFEGYVIGVSDSLDKSLAIPDSTSYDQIVAGAAKYLKAHPELWNQPAYDLVTRALFETFPRR